MTEAESKKDEKKIVLDGKEISQDQLQEVKSKSNIRLHQEGDNTFRTLHRFAE